MAKTKTTDKELKLGRRKVSDMNFSKIVTLPKPFTDNYLDENRTVEMSMTPDGRLTLTPVRRGN
jgi:hypothetical protein